MTASLTSLARPSAPSPVIGREGTVAAGTVLPPVPACTDTGEACVLVTAASPACLVCGAPAEPGDDLCRSHGGMTDGIERHAAMRAVA